jgi:hypothetical protein
MNERPRPRGYVGTNHETIGSDILAVVESLQFPEQVLGAPLTEELRRIDRDGWYPISRLLDLMDQLDAKLGRYGMLKMGRTLFRLSHEANVKRNAKSARDIIYGIDAMYHHANRGTGIGGWHVLSFEPGRAELEKTTPHHCVMEEGILSQGLSTVGVPALVSQSECLREGARICHYVVTSAIADKRWTG